jgi:hypothetical protein
MTSPIRRLACLAVALHVLLGAGPSPAPAATPPASKVRMGTLGPGGGTAAYAPEDVRPLEGVTLDVAVKSTLADDAYVQARFELTAMGDFKEDLAQASAYVGLVGPDRDEVEVVLVPFMDEKSTGTREGLIAVARSGERKIASYCVLEKAVEPSLPGAVGLEIPIKNPEGVKLWLWEPEVTSNGDEPPSRAKMYFSCVLRKTLENCAVCVARCLIAPPTFSHCVGYCCAGAFGYAVIACAVKMLFV